MKLIEGKYAALYKKSKAAVPQLNSEKKQIYLVQIIFPQLALFFTCFE